MLKFRLGLSVALPLVLLAGCYKNAYAPASISGRVTYKGNPVPGGTITFHPEGGKSPYSKFLDPEGRYEITDVLTGENVKVTIETESLNPKNKKAAYPGKASGSKVDAEYKKAMDAMKGQQAGQPTGTYVPIPAKYRKAKDTPLAVAIEAGSQTHNFELTD
jgi:hypothetical protein